MSAGTAAGPEGCPSDGVRENGRWNRLSALLQERPSERRIVPRSECSSQIAVLRANTTTAWELIENPAREGC